MKTEFSGELVVKWTNDGSFYNGRYQVRGGRFTLYRDKAFPATKEFLSKWLKKIVPLDPVHEVETLTDLVEYLEYNIMRTTQLMEEQSTKYAVAAQKRDDLRRLYETGKNPNGTKCDNRPKRSEVSDAKKSAEEINSMYRWLKRRRDMYKSNLEMINERLEVIK